MSREEVVEALIAERYAKPTWWKTPERGVRPTVVAPEFDNSEVACAARRRALAADFKAFESRGPVDRCG